MRILAENSLRSGSRHVQQSTISAIYEWIKTGNNNFEMTFTPQRILMHDTTCGPALVDIAAMRDELVGAGIDPSSLNPKIPIDISTDHSLSVDYYGDKNSAQKNVKAEFEMNSERYKLMKWAEKNLSGLTVHQPGTGIMHTINLEQLATVVSTIGTGEECWAMPETLIGTDSHTPMINGIGVLGWGVGGIEAEAAMFGVPLTMRLPKIVGVNIKGTLGKGVLATDVALSVTQILRGHQLENAFVEFFGIGVSKLPASTRATIANMAPEFGGTTGYFPIDEASLGYLQGTGRPARQLAFIKAYAKRTGLWFDPDNHPKFDHVIEIDLSQIRPSLAGPLRPQDRIDISSTKMAMEAVTKTYESCVKRQIRWPIAIAAITSCTNTSDIGALIAAGLLAQKAVALGLKPKSWVKTSLAPGSPTAEGLLQRSGLLVSLEAIGFSIVGYGCTTCIGQSGPLAPTMDEMLDQGCDEPIAVISGNRNFPGRIHPQIGHTFLASPALVIAFALVGHVNLNIANDPLGEGDKGKSVYLSDIWPDDDDIAALVRLASVPESYAVAFQNAGQNPLWSELETTKSPTYAWEAKSTVLCPPPFCKPVLPRRNINFSAAPLVVLGDDITTDHISPAGRISLESDAGQYLLGKGENADAFGVFAARRGNWEIMRRGLFSNPSLINFLNDRLLPGTSIFPVTGKVEPIWVCAEKMQAENMPAVIFAGERYGMGSSRDWAAKGLHILGVRAVLANSFERIHRTNLVGMGILPLQLSSTDHPKTLGLTAEDRIEISIDLKTLVPDQDVEIKIVRSGVTRRSLQTIIEIKTTSEIKQIIAGGILPLILKHAGVIASP